MLWKVHNHLHEIVYRIHVHYVHYRVWKNKGSGHFTISRYLKLRKSWRQQCTCILIYSSWPNINRFHKSNINFHKKPLCTFQRQDSYLINMHIKNKTSWGYKKQLILQNEIPPHEIYVHNLIYPNTPPFQKGPRTPEHLQNM